MIKRNSLEVKLCILIAGLFFALLIAVSHIQASSAMRLLVSERTQRYQILSSAISHAYARNDPATYRDLTASLMRLDDGISFVMKTDSSGRLLSIRRHGISDAQRASLEGKPIAHALKALRHRGYALNDEFELIPVPTTVGKRQRGTVYVGLKKSAVDDAVDELEARSLTVFSMVFLVALISIILLSRDIAQPIKRLTHALQSVMGGCYDVKLDVHSEDEVGELTRTFNLMVEQLSDHHSELVTRANTDSLTGLVNHRHFHERLATELNRAVRYRRPASLVMLDIDHFKTLNDAHGHPFGDWVLQEVARILLAESRDMDVVARYGGEEFALILPETVLSDAAAVAERIRMAIQQYRFVENDGACVRVTISLGVSAFPENARDAEGLVSAADLAMYQSKANGRDRTTVFSGESSPARESFQTDPREVCRTLDVNDMSTVEAVAAAVDARSHRRPGFSQEVSAGCMALGERLGLPEECLSALKIASRLYDIGKLGILESILTKPGKLNEEEQRVMRSHPALGYSLVRKVERVRPVLPSILHHHECWDGSGYPNGLKADDIPILARVIAIVDAYQAMITDRPFSKASAREYAVAELRRCSGTQFDPRMVKVFVEMLESEIRRARAA